MSLSPAVQLAAVDTQGARTQTLGVFVYEVDNDRVKGASDREPLVFREVHISQVSAEDFRKNPGGELGTRTATLDKEGIARFCEGWVYKDPVESYAASTWRA